MTLTRLQSTPVVILVGTILKKAAQSRPWVPTRRANLEDTAKNKPLEKGVGQSQVLFLFLT